MSYLTKPVSDGDVIWISYPSQFQNEAKSINQETSQLLDPEWGLSKEGEAVQFYTYQCACPS